MKIKLKPIKPGTGIKVNGAEEITKVIEALMENGYSGNEKLVQDAINEDAEYISVGFMCGDKRIGYCAHSLSGFLGSYYNYIVNFADLIESMEPENVFKVGDRVKVRKWDDMVKEFGVVNDCIECRFRFYTKMRHLCGRTARITKIDGDIFDLDFDDKSGDTSWLFSADMLEAVENEEKIIISQKGNQVVAKNLITKKEGIANCNPEDEFDFYKGAALALERLEKDEKTKKPKNYLSDDGWFYGEIGEPTNLKDSLNQSLFIGDVVEVYNPEGRSLGFNSVVKNKEYFKECFIMSIQSVCDKENYNGWAVKKVKSYKEMKNGEKVGCIKYHIE